MKTDYIDRILMYLEKHPNSSSRGISVGAKCYSAGHLDRIMRQLVNVKKVEIVKCQHCDSSTRLYKLK